MADVTANATILHKEGSGEKTVLYRVANVDTADTINVSTQFSEVKAASFIAAGALSTIGTVGIGAGPVLTLTLSTMVDDAIYLLVVGAGAA